MEYAVLGRTGLRVSRVGCGEGGIGQVWGDLPHALSADDALGPVLDAYHQRQHTGKTRFIGIGHGTGAADRAAAPAPQALRYGAGV